MSNSLCLWAKARENLPVDVKDWLASLEQGTQPNATGTEQIAALIQQTSQKQKELEKTSDRFRKYFDKIIHWLDKFKGIGDVVSSFDPVHAALPWAAFRFVLQAIMAEREQTDSVLELLASTPHFVFSGRVLEKVYTKESMHIGGTLDDGKLSQQCLDNLHKELIKLYSALLGALQYCYLISSQHKVKRKATAIFNSSELVSIHKDLEVQHTKVLSCGENCHKILTHTLSRKSLDLLGKVQPSLTELGDQVRELLVRIDESERCKTLGAISSILFLAHHDEVSGKRTEGTCEWILKKEKFIQWRESDSSVTILYGNPGAGKTFLISRVVDYSIKKAETSEALAFFYCKRDEENRRNPQDILRSILRQLSTPVKKVERGTIHVALKDLPNRLALNGTTINVSTCESLIGKLVEDYPRTTIILDALDECDRNTREELMRVLSNLTNGSSKLRVFISSRHDEDILRHFNGIPTMEMQATDNEEDISSFVHDRLFQDSRWADLSPELQGEVKAVFHEKSLGMFQWAALQVDQIRRLRLWSKKNIREQLKISPIGLKGAYDVVWNQMQELSPYEEQLARRALQWVLCALRPLDTPELSLMMQIDPDSGMTEPSTIFNPKAIQSICGNLLVYDRQSSVWRFSHLSAREYIEKHHYSVLESHHYVAVCSIKFLQRDLVWLPASTKPHVEAPSRAVAYNRSDLDGPCVEYTATCDYIFKQVFRHVHEVDLPNCRQTELTTLLQNFFEPISQGGPSFKAWRQVSADWEYKKPRRFRFLERSDKRHGFVRISSTPLQVMSIFGLFHILRGLWENARSELNAFPISTPSPLTLAIMWRREPIWRFILLANGKINTGTPGPLVISIQDGYPEAYEALLEAGADVNHVDTYHYPFVRCGHRHIPMPDTPLKAAALLHSKGPSRKYFVQTLIDRGADVNLKTENGNTLEVAVRSADEETVKILLDANTETYSPDYLLRLAAKNWRFNLVPLFVRLGANVEGRWEGVSPLVWALRKKNLANVRTLLEMSGTRIDLSCQDHRAAVLSTLKYSYGGKVFTLPCVSGVCTDCNAGKTYALKRAITSYPKYECEFHGLGFPESRFGLSFIKAVAHHQLELFENLLKAGADPSVNIDFGFGSTLTAAAFHGRLHHFHALLDQEEVHDKRERKGFFRDALFAVMSGHLSFISCKSFDNLWKPSSIEALCPKHLEVLQLLFERPLDVYMPIYGFLDSLIPVVQINLEGYEVKKPCRLYQEGYFGCFSRFWFFVLWDLQNGTPPQLPLRSRLRLWQFPGTLPHRFAIVTKLTALSRARPAYFITLSIRGNRSQFIIVPAQQGVRGLWSHRSDDRRWKRYKPESFGVMRYSDPEAGTGSSNTEVVVGSGDFEAYIDSRYSNSMVWVLFSFMVGLTSCFIMALSLPTKKA
ncbi:hypothetical protein NW756_005645 [Fusarium oxysporum]|nr:hypothetical protein NW763_013509 [Fusarium oxysporum]KAJ4041339.1 hypothetical protein NW753_010749 [Fusarium oxysporum]KAJ4091445.1 hypothetical protein NW756_005645 [Fusarium oxysporum]KAJ4092622.1 hypothetical protein NW769_012616 [Fusarium oxysporum]KAJ4220162.1 hypothetical protein NW760_012081 [Fusarium oxysporum]